MLVAEKACAPGESIHHEAGEITPEKVLHALLAANAIGEKRKNRQIP
jgi:glycerol dehydrogenase